MSDGSDANDNTNTIPSAYCSTAAGTAAKTASCTDYALLNNSYLHVLIKTANTSATALTFNVNSKGAKPIYINGTASSTTNYTLPAGTYIVFYDGTNYYFRTDGKLPADIAGDAATVGGHTVAANVPSDAKFTDNNTTYTFANGTNGFTVTPSGGSAQTVTVTPSITNNVTGSGTSGYIAKFNGANTITSGPQLGSSTSTYLRNDGTWATPPGTGDVNVIETVKVDGTALTVTNKAVDITGKENTSNKVTSISSSSTDIQYPSAKAVYDAIDALPEPMVFKGSLGTGGTITALPVNGSATIGDTYKVITAGTYASKSAKVGDTFICLTKTASANTWELIPSGDEPNGTVTSVTIKATSPIAIDSSSAITTSGTRTLSHANSGVTAGTYKSVTVNATGHITEGTNPTTLSGYGITDAKIASGVITLGSNTITPLTSSSSLNAAKLTGTVPAGCYTDTTYNDFTGANGSTAGSAGLVPAPAATDNTKFLKGDGTWGTPAGASYTAGDNISISNNVISLIGQPMKFITSGTYNLWELDDGIYCIDNSTATIYYDQYTPIGGTKRIIMLYSLGPLYGYKIFYEFMDDTNLIYTGKTAQSYYTRNALCDLSNYVTTITSQTITGTKTFTQPIGVTSSANISYNSSTDRIEFNFA